MKECWRASSIWSFVKEGTKPKLSEKKEYECQSVFPSREMQAWGGDSLSLFSFLSPPHIYPSIHLRFLPVTSCCQTLRQGHQVRRRRRGGLTLILPLEGNGPGFNDNMTYKFILAILFLLVRRGTNKRDEEANTILIWRRGDDRRKGEGVQCPGDKV